MRALVIEGGGMRATYANGVLAAFEHLGHRDFDAVYGTSAGGALAGWWSAEQARYALKTWRYAQDRRVLSYRRWLFMRGPLLDHDGIFRIVYETEMPLDVARIMRAPHPVVVTVANVDTGGTEYHDVRKGPVLAWLRATGRLPLGTGPPVEIDGQRYIDGGMTDPIPLARAIADGCKDITLVLNRPRGERTPEPRLPTEIVCRRFPTLAEATRLHHELHNRAVRLAENPPPGVRVRIVRPREETGAHRLSRDMETLERAMQRGIEDGARFLGQPHLVPPVTEMLKP